MDIAQGDYITFADQDDSILDGYAKFLRRCIDEQLDIIITAPYNRKAGTDNTNLREFREEFIDDPSIIKKMAGKLIDGNYLSDDSAQFVSTSVWNVIYRKRMLQDHNIRFKVFIDYEDDWIFNIETLMTSKKIAVTSDGYYCWNIHEGSESHRKKYIPDLFVRRKRRMAWLSTILDAMDIDDEASSAFVENVLLPRNIMMCFNNACWKPGASKDDILNEIVTACEGWDIKQVKLSVDEMNKSSRLLLWLLYHGKTAAAYDLNRKLIKSRFH